MKKEINKRHKQHKSGDSNSKLSPRQRHWCFTLNNWTENDVAQWHNQIMELKMKKFYFQAEIGKENKTPHLQGVVSFINPQRLYTLNRLLPRAHWSVCRNIKASYKYCMKEDTATGEAWSWTLPGIKPSATNEDEHVLTDIELNEGLLRAHIAWAKDVQSTEQLVRDHEFTDPVTGDKGLIYLPL